MAEAPAVVLESPRLFHSATRLASAGEHAKLQALLDTDTKLMGTKDEYGCDSLIWAARNGRQEVVQYLMEKDADLASKSYLKMAPLHHAVNNNYEEIIRGLLDKSADVNAQDEMGNTPLHYAAKR